MFKKLCVTAIGLGGGFFALGLIGWVIFNLYGQNWMITGIGLMIAGHVFLELEG